MRRTDNLSAREGANVVPRLIRATVITKPGISPPGPLQPTAAGETEVAGRRFALLAGFTGILHHYLIVTAGLLPAVSLLFAALGASVIRAAVKHKRVNPPP